MLIIFTLIGYIEKGMNENECIHSARTSCVKIYISQWTVFESNTILLFLSYFFHGVLLLYNNMQKWWCLLRELAIIEYFLRCHFSTLSLALFNLSFLHYGSCLVHSGWQNPTSAGIPGITLFLNDFQHLSTRKKRIATGKSKKGKPGACRGLSKPGPTPWVFAPKTHEASW